MAHPNFIVNQAVGYFLILWNNGLQPSLIMNVLPNGAIYVNSTVTSLPPQPSYYQHDSFRKRSGGSSRKRRRNKRVNIHESSTDSHATEFSHVDALTDVTTTETDVTENELQVEAEDEFYFNSGQTLTFDKSDLHYFEELTRNDKLHLLSLLHYHHHPQDLANR